jgi:hypothetical protein
MKIYKFTLQDADYEMYDGFVIVARSAREARKILEDRLVDTLTEGRARDYQREEIILDGLEPGVILASFTGA